MVWRSGKGGKTTDEQSHDQGHCLRAELIVCQKNRRQEGLAFIHQLSIYSSTYWWSVVHKEVGSLMLLNYALAKGRE